MIKEILTAENPSLRKKSDWVNEITPGIKALIGNMRDTLIASQIKGIGLAAPQIGVNLRVIIVIVSENKNDKILTLINPEILSSSGEEEGVEGCLCFPHLYGLVKRAKKMKVSALDEKGRSVVSEFKGLAARVIQHEIDHLNGILFVDRVTDIGSLRYEGPVLRK